METYLALDLDSKKFYVGSSKNFESRQKRHFGSDLDTPFHRSLRKRPDRFLWIRAADTEDREEEQFYLDFYFGSSWCYNLSAYATGGFTGNVESAHTRTRELVKEGKHNFLSSNRDPEVWDPIYQRSSERVISTRLTDLGLEARVKATKGTQFYLNTETNVRKRFKEDPGSPWVWVEPCPVNQGGTKFWVNSEGVVRRTHDGPPAEGGPWQNGILWKGEKSDS